MAFYNMYSPMPQNHHEELREFMVVPKNIEEPQK